MPNEFQTVICYEYAIVNFEFKFYEYVICFFGEK